MFENFINKNMRKAELVGTLGDLKNMLVCRKRAILLEMGYEEMDYSTSLVSEISKPSFAARCEVIFFRNANRVRSSWLSFAMEPRDIKNGIGNCIKEISDDVIEACAEVFGMHDLELIISSEDPENTYCKSGYEYIGTEKYPYKRRMTAGTSEEEKRIDIMIEESYHENPDEKVIFIVIRILNSRRRWIKEVR